MTARSTDVRFTGTVDLTTLNLNPGATIIIKSGNTIYRGHLSAINSATRLTLVDDKFDDPPAFPATGCSFSLSNFKHSINDTNSFYDFSAGGNGKLWVSPGAHDEYPPLQKRKEPGVIAAVTKGSAVIDFTGNIDLSAWQLRAGDCVRVGSGAHK